MSEISDLQLSIDKQIAVQQELIKADLAKTEELKVQNAEIRKNNDLREIHNELLKNLIVEVEEVVTIITTWDERNFFNNIYHLMEIILPLLLSLELKDENIESLKNIAISIGKRDVNIKELKGNKIALGDEISFE